MRRMKLRRHYRRLNIIGYFSYISSKHFSPQLNRNSILSRVSIPLSLFRMNEDIFLRQHDVFRDTLTISCQGIGTLRRTVLLFQFHKWTVTDLSRRTSNKSQELSPTWRQRESKIGTRVRVCLRTSYSSTGYARPTICYVGLTRQGYCIGSELDVSGWMSR